MKKTSILNLVMLATLLTGCNFNCSVGEKKGGVNVKTVTSNDNTTLNGAIIKNDIDLDATGVKLKSAYLLDASNNPLKVNETRLGEKIYLVLEMDTGWVKENGKSFIGAGEKILTSAGRVVVSAEDIFIDYETTGVDQEDAKYITLSAVITNPETGMNDFTVHFRVWDKRKEAEVKGKYKFKLVQ